MSHLHNGYVETLVKGGIIAIVLLATILIKTVLNLFKIRSKYKYDYVFLCTGLLMVLFHNFTETSLLKGLNPLNIFMDFFVVSTSLVGFESNNESPHRS
jgi:O-antigen ligase